MAVDITERQISVRLIYYKEESRWALACRIKRRAVSYGTAYFRIPWKKSVRWDTSIGINQKSPI